MPRTDKEARNEYMREYNRRNPEKKAASDKASRLRHLDSRKKRERAYAASHRAENRARSREYHYQTKYGMSVEDKKKMFETQKGLCYICDKPMPSWEESHVDHNHLTEEVRGLSHFTCNIRLGVVENLAINDPATLMSMLRISNYPTF